MTAQELKNSILQLAVQGKLVPQCKDDEPASELVKQIRAVKEKAVKKEKPLPEIIEEEKPFDIPDSWEWIKLGELVSVISGTSYKSSNVCNNGIRILRGGNIQESKVLYYTDDVFLPEAFFDEEKSIKNGDILIVASTGSKAVIGKPGFVFKSDEKTQIGAFLRIVRPHSQQINDFIRIIFNSEFYRNHIRTNVQGMNINNVRTEHITEFIVPIPPLAEQKRIVEKIEELMPLIEEYGKAEEQLSKLNAEFPDKLRKSILQQAVQGKLTERDPADEPASELLKRIKAGKEALIKSGKIKKEKPLPAITDDEKPFDIPETWAWSSINELFWVTKLAGFEYAKYFTKEQISPKNKVKIVRAQNVKMNRFVENDNEAITEQLSLQLERSALTVNCILMTFIGAGIGDTCLYCSPYRHHLAPNVAKIVPVTENIYLPYYLIWLMSPVGQASVEAIKKSTAQPSLSMETIRSIRVAIPPLAEQKRIVKRVEELLALCDELKQ